MAQVFEARFIDFGGEIVYSAQVSDDYTDFQPTIDAILERQPVLLFMTLRHNILLPFIEQGQARPGFDNMALLNTDTLYQDDGLEPLQTLNQAVYLTIPSPILSAAGQAIVSQYEQIYGGAPTRTRFLNAYDATNLLLDALEQIAVQEVDGTLHIGRQALRNALHATEGYQGATGRFNCTEFGDCVITSFNVVLFDGVSNPSVEALQENVVYTNSYRFAE